MCRPILGAIPHVLYAKQKRKTLEHCQTQRHTSLFANWFQYGQPGLRACQMLLVYTNSSPNFGILFLHIQFYMCNQMPLEVITPMLLFSLNFILKTILIFNSKGLTLTFGSSLCIIFLPES